MPLGWIGDQNEGAASAQLEVGHLNSPVDAADDQSFFTPIELEGFAQGKLERDVGALARLLSRVFSPAPDKFRDSAVATGKAVGAEFLPEFQCGTTIAFRTVRIRLQRFAQPVLIRRQFPFLRSPPVFRLRSFRRFEPFLYGVARQARTPRNLGQGELVPVIHPSNLSQQGHGDHSKSPA